jgi:hypothetical protein
MVPNKLLSKSLGMGKRNHINKFTLEEIQECKDTRSNIWRYSIMGVSAQETKGQKISIITSKAEHNHH